ncbi:MAG: SMC-Scp complex subunit ScpB [Pirellulaceae bacterium]
MASALPQPENHRPHDGAEEIRDPEGDGGSDLELDGFAAADDVGGLSLDQLSDAYSQLLNDGENPYVATAAEEHDPDTNRDSELLSQDQQDTDSSTEISPTSILEAMLFVGHPANQPLTSRYVASLMRGVSPREIDDLVVELNEQYAADGAVFQIKNQGAGYVMTLREQFHPIREKFYGRTRDARLSQATVDVLAIVAYHQGISRDEIDKLRDENSGSMLSQLVRRQLLRIEREEGNKRKPKYFTTDRFLKIFGIESVEDLPQAHIVEQQW